MSSTGHHESDRGLGRPRLSLRLKLAALAALLATVPPAVVGYRLIDVNAVTVELLSREVRV